jgi:2-keto-3-deoxy-L-rhamnonate aldolase RhmA
MSRDTDGEGPRHVVRSEVLLGSFLNLGSPVTSEIVGIAGFDWVAIDLEHGHGGEQDLLCQIQAISHTSVMPFVRLESAERARFAHALDAGAVGVIVPRIEGASDAKAAAANCRYRGARGVSRYNRSWAWGMRGRSVEEIDSQTVCGIQIETLGALEEVDEIARDDEVDLLFVGPGDLGHVLGISGEPSHPELVAAVERVVEAARSHGKAAGALVPDVAAAKLYLDLGVTFLACSSDSGLLARCATEAVQQLSEVIGRNPATESDGVPSKKA